MLLFNKSFAQLYVVKRMQVVFVLPHDEASRSASGLHAVAGVVRVARVGGLPLPFLDLDSFGPRARLDAEEIKSARISDRCNK